jgi:hypothetical protein
MKKLALFFAMLLISTYSMASFFTDEYTTTVAFPSGFQVGDYYEFVQVQPISAGASGYYEISISYTRGNVAAAATHIAAISHANSNLWREAGRINGNGYVDIGHSFTIDCNGQSGNGRFRIRATATLGVITDPINVYVKVRSINSNSGFTALSFSGNDLTVNKLAPMTGEWSLYIGNSYSLDGAKVAIKAIENGNVGIGTAKPAEKLSVNGKIKAREIKVENDNWPDYVFYKTYDLRPLSEVEKNIKDNGHLPDIPSAAEVKANGINLGEINEKLLKKIEELTLYLIEENKQRKFLFNEVEELKLELKAIKGKKK